MLYLLLSLNLYSYLTFLFDIYLPLNLTFIIYCLSTLSTFQERLYALFIFLMGFIIVNELIINISLNIYNDLKLFILLTSFQESQ